MNDKRVRMSDKDFKEWLDGWFTDDVQRWLPLRSACLSYWRDCFDFRLFVEACISQDRPEEVLCWVQEHM